LDRSDGLMKLVACRKLIQCGCKTKAECIAVAISVLPEVNVRNNKTLNSYPEIIKTTYMTVRQ